MQNDERSEPGLRATALLNLSTAQLAVGDPSAAGKSAAEASEQFLAAQDVLGEAQALHAGGVALQRAGQANEATTLLTRATERFAAATSVDGQNGAGRVPTPINPGIGPLIRRIRPDLLDRGPALARQNRNILLDRVVTSDFLVDDVAVATPSRVIAPAARPTADVSDLTFIANSDVSRVSLRWPTAEEPAFSSVDINDLAIPVARRHDWSVGIPVGDAVESISWSVARPPTADVLIDTVYRPRLNATTIAGLRWWWDSESTTAAYLTHLYSYVIPLGLGDCYHHAGNYERAEEYYLQAAAYTSSPDLEAPRSGSSWPPTRWSRGTRPSVAGPRHRQGGVPKLARSDGTRDAQAPLYSTAVFAAIAAEAVTVLDDPQNVPDTVNPAVAHLLLTVLARWEYLNAGLDFYGLTFTPVFTFGTCRVPPGPSPSRRSRPSGSTSTSRSRRRPSPPPGAT